MKTLTFIIMLLITVQISAQYDMKVIKTDSSNVTIPTDSIARIEFAEIQSGGEPCPGVPTVTYEGKTYNTVQIGDQCWLKENLDVGEMVQGSAEQWNNGTLEKYCYDDESSNCDEYGGLY